MAAWPTTDPVEAAYTGLTTPGRVIVVYNTDVSWSLTLAQRYARRKHIPEGNLFGYAFGTGAHWIPANKTAILTMCQALETLWLSVGAQCILLAPGCPNGVEVTGTYDAGSIATAGAGPVADPAHWYPAAVGYPDLGRLCAFARQFVNSAVVTAGGINNIFVWQHFGGNHHWGFYNSGSGNAGWCFNEYISSPTAARYIRNAGGISGFQPTYEPIYSPSPYFTAFQDMPIVAQVLVDLLGTSSNRALPYGRIGIWWNTYSIYPQPDPCPYTMDFETQQRAMEQGLRYSDGCSPGNRYRSPIHFQLWNTDSYQGSLAYYCSVLGGLGYNVSYNYAGTSSADMLSYCPAAGASFTIADAAAGKVKDQPYHVMIGVSYPNAATAADSPFKDPWASLFKPTSGAGSAVGQSFGWGQCIEGLHRGASSGLTNSSHITSGIYAVQQSFLQHLLQGMNWAEASFFTSYMNPQMPPCGDPLARPFPVN